MNNLRLKQAAVLGGITAALTDAVPFLNLINCLCCLGLAAGGVVAVLYLYSNDSEKQTFSLPELIQIGLWTGITGALFAFVFHYIVFQILGNWQIEWIGNMIENMEEIPPMWEDIYQELQSPEMQGFAGMAILIRSLILFPVFTFLGALFTNRVLERRQRI
jgi:hypothetical protein